MAPTLLPLSVNDRIHRLWSEHPFIRFSSVGATNTVLMFAIFSFFVFILDDASHSRTFAWSISWGIECIIAYFLHRRITFRYEGALVSSFARTMVIYGIALVGSTFTYEMLDYKWGLPYLVAWLSNGMAWGIFNFLALGRFAMHQPEDDSAHHEQ